MQQFHLLGNVAKQAEVRSTANGSQAIGFRVAANESYKDAQGVKVEKVTYYKVVQWKKADQSTKVAEFLKPGQAVSIIGRPKAVSYVDKDGVIQSEIEVTVEKLELVGTPKKAADVQQTVAA